MEKEIKQPKIRFKGYTDAWEQRKLGDIADVTKLAGFEFTKYVTYSDEGQIIALRGLNVKNGHLVLEDVKYIDSSDFSKLNRSKLYKNDILFTYVGTVGELAVVPEDDKYYLAPNVARIRMNKGANSLFVSQMMNGNAFYNRIIFPLIATSSQPALSMENVRKFTLKLPSEEEQSKIAGFLGTLDHLITLHQRESDNVIKLKKTMLSKMFPRNGEKFPEVRFSGFTDAWEQRRLSNISEKVIEKNKDNLFSETLTNSAEHGIINQRDFFDKDISNEKNLDGYYVVRENDFVYNPRISNFAPVGPIKRNKLGRTGVMSPLYYVFRTEEIDNSYLEYFFENTTWHKFMKLNGDSGARSDRFAIKDSVFREMPIPYPSLAEQEKIGKFFDSLTILITLHQRELEKLQDMKKTLLKKMFV